MPRRPRLLLPGIPLHITQRGVNRGATFVDADDHRLYRSLMVDVLVADGIAIHAYALMGNHVHLLVTPASESNLSHAMRRLNQRYVGAFNRRHGRTGTLWESRFRSCLVQTDGYLLTLYRYIDLNPVRAAIVATAEDYRWSSARANLAIATDACLTPHPVYLTWGLDAKARALRYGEWLRSGISDSELASIRSHVRQERALGSLRFQAFVEQALNRPVAVRPRGRPRALAPSTDRGHPEPADSNG
jgi:putative transposase